MSRMTFKKWQSVYRPQKHGLRTKSFSGCLYDPLDDREKFSAFERYNAMPNHVWTFMELDGGLYISAGWGLVNRLGYFVCEKPFEDERTAPEIYLGRF